MWLVFLLAHLFGTTGYNTALRHATAGKKLDPIFLSAIMSTAIAAPAIFGVCIAEIDWRAILDMRVLPFYLIVVISQLFFHIVNTNALELMEASVFSCIFNFRLGIATLFGIWFLSEPVIPLRLVGGAFVFLAGFLLMGKSTSSPKGILFSVLTAVLHATFTAFEKHLISDIGYATYVFPSSIAVCAALWTLVLVGKHPVDLSFLKSREFIPFMVFRCASAYGFTLAFNLGALLSVATYVSALSCVTTPIAAVIFLKETDALAKKILAGGVALAGVTLIFLAVR